MCKDSATKGIMIGKIGTVYLAKAFLAINTNTLINIIADKIENTEPR